MSTTTPHPDYRSALKVALSGFPKPATRENSMARAAAFICALAGTVTGSGDAELGGAIFAIVQPPETTAAGTA